MPFNPAEPNHQLYGIIPQYYAASLAQSTGDPTADAINRITLGAMARGSSGLRGYEQLIREANQAGMQAHTLEEQGKIDVAYLNNAKNLVDSNISRAVLPSNNTSLQIDPKALAQADAFNAQQAQADMYSKIGTATNQLSEAGVAPEPDRIAGMMTPPWASLVPQAPQTGYANPGDKAAQDKAKADMVSAEAAKQRAANGEGSPETKTVTSYILDRNGNRVPLSVEVTEKGRPSRGAAPTTTKTEMKYIPDPNNPQRLIKNPKYKGD